MDIPALPFLHVPQIAQIPSQPIENLKSMAEHLKRRRLQLYLKQAEVAAQIGVSEDCITYWENNRSQPQINHYPKIIQFLGYVPISIDETTLGGRIKKYRVENGLSMKRFAKRIGVDERTVVLWECNRTVPKNDKYEILKEFIGK